MIPAVTAGGAVGPAQDDPNQLGPFRVGQLIEAKVDSIGENGIARLIVAGMAVYVSSPVRLTPGAVIEFRVKQPSESGLILELKRPESVERSTQPTAAHGSTSLVGARGPGLLSALLDIGAAQSAARSGLAAADPKSLDRGGSPPLSGDSEAGTSVAQHMHFAVVQDARQHAGIRSRSLPSPRPAQEHRNDPEAHADAKLQNLAPTDQPTPPQSTAINVPFASQMERLQIVVKRHDQDEEDNWSDEAGKSMEARLSVDSETLGRVHVVMRQHGSAISISLWAERPEVAAELLRERAELRDEVGAAGVEVEALEIFAGAPPVAASCTETPAESAVS
jgi:hypothetical protein